VVQGLSNDSFLQGNNGFSARHGTTTAAAADTPQLDPDAEDAFEVVPYQSVTRAPRIQRRPLLRIPPEVENEEIQGRVEVVLTIGGDGAVTDVEVVGSLHPAADAACVDAMRTSRWSAGTREGTPVTVRGVPYSCLFQLSVE